jgi:hypothetical protein
MLALGGGSILAMKIDSQSRFIKVDSELLDKIKQAIQVALAYERATNGSRKLGITGEVGEVLMCKQLGLRMTLNPRSEGYDAIDKAGKHVQIKARRSESGNTPKKSGRLSRFSEHKFDYALLGILDSQYRLTKIWRADYQTIEPVISKQKRRNPSLASFIGIAHQVFP